MTSDGPLRDDNESSREHQLERHVEELQTRVDELETQAGQMHRWFRYYVTREPDEELPRKETLEEKRRRRWPGAPTLLPVGLGVAFWEWAQKHPALVTAFGATTVAGAGIIYALAGGPPDSPSRPSASRPPVTLPSAPPPSPVVPSPSPDKPETEPSPDETQDDSDTMNGRESAPERRATSPGAPGPVTGDDTVQVSEREPQPDTTEPESPGEADDDDTEQPAPDLPEPPDDGGDADDGGNGDDSDGGGGGQDEPRRDRCLVRVDVKNVASACVPDVTETLGE